MADPGNFHEEEKKKGRPSQDQRDQYLLQKLRNTGTTAKVSIHETFVKSRSLI
jgi:hypothetical protein